MELVRAGVGNILAQALGTSFERRFMTPAAAAMTVGLGRLAVER